MRDPMINAVTDAMTDEMTDHVEVKFWGTRGSLAVNGPAHKVFGGNTSCIEMRSSGQSIIFDAGSGLLACGEALLARGVTEIDIFLTHFHADHLCGLPFFQPFFEPAFSVRLHSFDTGVATTEAAVDAYMRPPLFPVTRDIFTAKVEYFTHKSDAKVDIGGYHIDACPIPHPGGAHALRATRDTRICVYATDTEHQPGAPSAALIDFMSQADLAIYDCTFSDEEFDARLGWGHSTWQEGVRLARAASVKQFAIFHHDPKRTDSALHDIENKARQMFDGAFAARDFQTVEL